MSIQPHSLKRHLATLLLSLCLLTACSDPQTQLERIQQQGEITILTAPDPSDNGTKTALIAGLEYALIERFADYLGVKVKLITPKNISKLTHLLNQQHADIAAAGLTVTKQRQRHLRFGPIYQQVTQQLVYRQGYYRPKNLGKLGQGLLEVMANSSHAEQLRQQQQDFPDLTWVENPRLNSRGLLELVQLEMIDYTIADSSEVAIQRNFFPELRVAFDLTEPQGLAWALKPSSDNSLYDELHYFFYELMVTGELNQLIAQYYGHIRRFDYVDTRALYRKIITHLPQYRPLFKQAAAQFNLNEDLLAAIAYQESHWDPEATSHTGVRGLMMITRATAKQMGIKDRLDPKQSIYAGAKYLDSLKKRLPERITEPDKTWLALAAYNIGLGHVEDARILTQQNGGNPDLWVDVKRHLPLLSKKKWYRKTRHGYARGGEPVRYIENIRRYYDILVYDKHKASQPPSYNEQKQANPPASL